MAGRAGYVSRRIKRWKRKRFSQKVSSNKLFGSCSCPQQTPVATASFGPSAPLGSVMDNCKQRGSFPQAAVSGYGKLEIQSKTRLDRDKMVDSIFSKSLFEQTFWPLQLPTANPSRYSQCRDKRSLGDSYGQLQAERKFPTSRVNRLWKT